jgi:hypothetical protein
VERRYTTRSFRLRTRSSPSKRKALEQQKPRCVVLVFSSFNSQRLIHCQKLRRSTRQYKNVLGNPPARRKKQPTRVKAQLEVANRSQDEEQGEDEQGKGGERLSHDDELEYEDEDVSMPLPVS